MVLFTTGALNGQTLERGRMATAEICAEVARYASEHPDNVKAGRKYFCTEEAHGKAKGSQ